ncbi:hypothetical protein COF68_04460 [Bacillus toyonensis]|uniref:hypothetical protein n=1 Tax=Bacillus toyonensis TaxID=155322 RepID=UPI000BFE08E7|nr:hypothetical protein [Bacillus toyonensis]PHE64108.1 hypothetical protein COF68_04460 [Bacillus toyonensis]
MKTNENEVGLTEEKEAFVLVIKAKSLNFPVNIDKTVDKMGIILDTLKKMSFTAEYKNSPVEYFPIRREVEILHDKLQEDENFIQNFREEGYEGYCSRLKYLVKRSRTNRSLTQDFGIDDFGLYNKSVNEIITEILEQNHNKVTVTTRNGTKEVTKEVMDEFIKYRQLKRQVAEFKEVYTKINSETHLPVFFKTTDYLKFDKGLSLISFRCDNTSQTRKSLTNSLLREFINELTNDGLELANLSHNRSSTIITVLIENEEVNRVLDLFSKSYKCLYGYTYMNSFNMDVTITRDIGQEEERTDWLFILNGKEFDVLRYKCTKLQDKYLGLDVHN